LASKVGGASARLFVGSVPRSASPIPVHCFIPHVANRLIAFVQPAHLQSAIALNETLYRKKASGTQECPEESFFWRVFNGARSRDDGVCWSDPLARPGHCPDRQRPVRLAHGLHEGGPRLGRRTGAP